MKASISSRHCITPVTSVVVKSRMLSDMSASAHGARTTSLTSARVISSAYRSFRAASRLCRRLPMLLYPLTAQLAIHIRHLNGRCRRFPALVPSFGPGTLYRLLDGIRGQHPKRHRNAAYQGRTGNALTGLSGNIIKMRGRTTNQGPETNHGITGSAEINELFRHHGNLKRPGDPIHRNALIVGAMA